MRSTAGRRCLCSAFENCTSVCKEKLLRRLSKLLRLRPVLSPSWFEYSSRLPAHHSDIVLLAKAHNTKPKTEEKKMKNLKNVLMITAGVVVGMLISVPAANAAAEYLTAVASPQTFYMDGQRINIEAYSINGSNYVKLRDIGKAVDFNVSYDTQTNSVRITPNEPYSEAVPAAQTVAPMTTPTASQSSYTISTSHWSREDFSQQANPSVFTGYYDRELYNTIRQTILGGTSQNPAYTMVAKGEDYSTVVNVLGRMSGLVRYEHHVPDNFSNYYEYLDYFAVSAEIPEVYEAPLEFIQPVIAKAAQMGTDREKVEYLHDYLCTLLTYDRKSTAGITRTFSEHSGELEAACGSYAQDFKFLCTAAGIPCITISTTNHTWNLVYANEQWLHVDVAYDDHNDSRRMLLAESYPNHPDTAPDATSFLKELLVPGSTK
ncbi:MAG: hypothetical protein NC489_28150 [Ruminococcus flavefaciens]|nr:hypothetical protein [Ruminococcus flavefaciens]